MKTQDRDYKDYIEGKYLPGRRFYLRYFYFPSILAHLQSGDVVDLGCGTGEFLRFLKEKGRTGLGIDSNPYLAQELIQEGLSVRQDDITELKTLDQPIKNAVVDNVLEHLTTHELETFFKTLKTKMRAEGRLVIVVPQEKGYRSDPTHRTYIDSGVIQEICSRFNLKMEHFFYHPINLKIIGQFLYLNMQVFVIRF